MRNSKMNVHKPAKVSSKQQQQLSSKKSKWATQKSEHDRRGFVVDNVIGNANVAWSIKGDRENQAVQEY